MPPSLTHPHLLKHLRTRTNLDDKGYASQPAVQSQDTVVVSQSSMTASQSFELKLYEQVPEEAIIAPADFSAAHDNSVRPELSLEPGSTAFSRSSLTTASCPFPAAHDS